MSTPKYIIIHHSGSDYVRPQFNGVNEWHKQQGYPLSTLNYHCGYHYFLETDAFLIQARLENDDGAHTIGHNQDSIGICLAGDFNSGSPTVAQTIVLKNLLIKLQEKYQIPLANIIPHRQGQANRSCYGWKLDNDWAKNLLNENLEKKLSMLKTLLELYQKLLSIRQKLGSQQKNDTACWMEDNKKVNL